MTPQQIFAEYDKGYFDFMTLCDKLHAIELSREAC